MESKSSSSTCREREAPLTSFAGAVFGRPLGRAASGSVLLRFASDGDGGAGGSAGGVRAPLTADMAMAGGVGDAGAMSRRATRSGPDRHAGGVGCSTTSQAAAQATTRWMRVVRARAEMLVGMRAIPREARQRGKVECEVGVVSRLRDEVQRKGTREARRQAWNRWRSGGCRGRGRGCNSTTGDGQGQVYDAAASAGAAASAAAGAAEGSAFSFSLAAERVCLQPSQCDSRCREWLQRD